MAVYYQASATGFETVANTCGGGIAEYMQSGCTLVETGAFSFRQGMQHTHIVVSH